MAFSPDRYSYERRRTKLGRSLYEVHDALTPGRVVATLASLPAAAQVVDGLNEDARREMPASVGSAP